MKLSAKAVTIKTEEKTIITLQSKMKLLPLTSNQKSKTLIITLTIEVQSWDFEILVKLI